MLDSFVAIDMKKFLESAQASLTGSELLPKFPVFVADQIFHTCNTKSSVVLAAFKQAYVETSATFEGMREKAVEAGQVCTSVRKLLKAQDDLKGSTMIGDLHSLSLPLVFSAQRHAEDYYMQTFREAFRKAAAALAPSIKEGKWTKSDPVTTNQCLVMCDQALYLTTGLADAFEKKKLNAAVSTIRFLVSANQRVSSGELPEEAAGSFAHPVWRVGRES